MKESMTTKEKGDLLEDIVEQICSGVKNAKVGKKVKILGKRSNNLREIDVLIEGKVGAFQVKIVIEAKNYRRPVGVEKVESLKSKLDDVGADMGVIACSSGFTKAAKDLAKAIGIKLYEVFDSKLGNSNLFIPLRYIEPDIEAFSFELHGKTFGPISIPQDISRWQFHVGNKILNARQLVWHAWNTEMIPQSAGEYMANFNAMTMGDTKKPDFSQYIEVKIRIQVIEKYFLKLLPASFLRESENGREHFNIDMCLYSDEKNMIKDGWKRFESIEAMNKATDIENQPRGIKDFILKPSYVVDLDRLVEKEKESGTFL